MTNNWDDDIHELRSLLNDIERQFADRLTAVRQDQTHRQIRQPKLSRLTAYLGFTVILLTFITGLAMFARGATMAQLLVSSLGELFLFFLVIASGLADLYANDSSESASAAGDELSRIAGIKNEMLKLAELRQRWRNEMTTKC